MLNMSLFCQQQNVQQIVYECIKGNILGAVAFFFFLSFCLN